MSDQPQYPSSQFAGDMSRNEVEMDLSKFMEMLQENAALKDKIREWRPLYTHFAPSKSRMVIACDFNYCQKLVMICMNLFSTDSGLPTDQSKQSWQISLIQANRENDI